MFAPSAIVGAPPLFRGIVRAFEELVRRFDVRFREAADLGCGVRLFMVPHAVDLVTANFGTLNHFLAPADLRHTLRRIALRLRPGGHLIFDFFTDRPRRGAWCRYRPLAELERERARAAREVTDALLDAGFIIRGVHDAHTLGRVQPHSMQLIVVAQRG